MAKPRPKAPSKKAAAPSRKPAPAKKAQPAKKAAPAKKPAPSKKAAPAKKKPAPAKKALKKAAPTKKTPPAKKKAPVKKAAPAKKAPPAKKKPAPARKAAPAKKAAPVKKVAPAKKAAPVRKAPPAKPVKPIKKVESGKKTVPSKKPAVPVKKPAEPGRKMEPIRKPQPPARRPPANDPALDAYATALQAFYQRSWEQAAELFEKSLAASDQLDLSARARQYLTACRQRLAEAGGPKTKKKDEDGDPFLRAVFEKNRGELATALDLCRKEGRDQKDERFAYLAASIHAAEGRLDEAAQALSQAIELNPKNRIHAFHDSDFAELRKDRDQRQLFGLS